MGNSTIFDDVLRTIQERLPKLLIPLVNEVFQTSYTKEAEVTRLPEEYQKLLSKVVVDSCNKIEGIIYHFECQSRPDGSMMFRMIEYDFMIALSGSKSKKDKKEIAFPRSCIIYLRCTKNMLSEETMELKIPNQKPITYRVPVLKLKDYSIDEIFEKNLLILLPYYIMNYEKDIFEIAKSEERTKKLIDEYHMIISRLEEVTKADNTGLFHDLMQLMQRVMNYLLRKEPILKERMSEEMGGKVLRLPSDELREAREAGINLGIRQGISKGISCGIETGKEEKTRTVVTNMIKRGISDADICAMAECEPEFVEQVRKKLEN